MTAFELRKFAIFLRISLDHIVGIYKNDLDCIVKTYNVLQRYKDIT